MLTPERASRSRRCSMPPFVRLYRVRRPPLPNAAADDTMKTSIYMSAQAWEARVSHWTTDAEMTSPATRLVTGLRAQRRATSQPLQEPQKQEALQRRQPQEAIARGRGLAAVQRDRVGDRAGPAVVQEHRLEAQPHQRLGPEVGRLRQTEANIGELRAHVVEQQVGVRVHGLEAQRPHRTGARDERGYMTAGAPELQEDQAAQVLDETARQGRRRGEQLVEGHCRVK